MSEKKYTILLVEDDLEAFDAAERTLQGAGYEVKGAHHGIEALDWVRAGWVPDVVLTDLRMPKMGGIDFLRALRLLGDSTPVVLMSALGTVEDAVEAMKLGAVDFLSKPFRRQALLDAIANAAKRAKGSQKKEGETLLLGRSEKMRTLRDQIARVAQTQATVLIGGESGSGKEIVARLITEVSPRSEGPWVAINCAALPESLLESELFGHEKGAFTGASQSKVGLFEAADGGTLFLDEIGDMPLALQAKLLRVLQEGEIRRVGSTSVKKVDVRVIAATHQNLEERVSSGQFRADLFFRLKVVSLEVPALRERKEDLRELVEHFLVEFAKQHEKKVDHVSDEAMVALTSHDWPGNVRELANAIERGVVFSQTSALGLRDLPEHLQGRAQKGSTLENSLVDRASGAKSEGLDRFEVKVGSSLKDVEDLLIRKTLEATGGDKSLTAQILGINERTIYRRLKESGSLLSFESDLDKA
jgi:two-component system response regulator HydG